MKWELVYKDEKNLEAKRKQKSLGFEQFTEVISVNYELGLVTVKSESLGNEMWDQGRNSKRVKMFIFAYEEILKTFDRASLIELEKEAQKKDNWDDYIIPDTLPPAAEIKTPNFAIPIIGGIFISLILGLVIAFISSKGLYIIGIFEVLVAIVIAFVMKYLIRFSNFTDFNRLQYLLGAVVVLTYLSNQYFLYEIILRENNFERIGFGEFIKIRFSAGLTIRNFNTGWIGLVISWIVQLGLTMVIVYLRVVSGLTKYLLERVPVEVVDFAFYHFLKEKSEAEVRQELSKKGWMDPDKQDEVFEAIGALQNATEHNRMK